MEEKKKVTASELKVGIFVIVAATLLALAIFTIGSQVGLLEDTFVAKTYLNNVSGLKPGDIVMLGGVEVGNVTEVLLGSEKLPDTQVNARQRQLIERLEVREAPILRSWLARQEQLEQTQTRFQEALEEHGPETPEVAGLRAKITEQEILVESELKNLDRVREQLDRARAGLQNIVLYLTIKTEYEDWIRLDSSISLGSVGLLGDKYIDISLGRLPDRPVLEEETVHGWFGETTRMVLPITGRTQSGFQELITGANDVLANMEGLSGTLNDIMRSFEEGEGTLGRFFSDDTFFHNINDTVSSTKETVQNAGRMFEQVSEGEGTIAQLIQQRELYDKLNASMERLGTIVTQIEAGEGTFGKFVNDPEVYDNANQVMANIRDITGRMDAGEGTLGKLVRDEQLYVDLRRTLDQMASVIQEIEEGKGTLGRLAKDEQLYENLNEVTSEVVKLLYDFRQNPKKFLTIKMELF